jgi:hypothetical protein
MGLGLCMAMHDASLADDLRMVLFKEGVNPIATIDRQSKARQMR